MTLCCVGSKVRGGERETGHFMSGMGSDQCGGNPGFCAEGDVCSSSRRDRVVEERSDPTAHRSRPTIRAPADAAPLLRLDGERGAGGVPRSCFAGWFPHDRSWYGGTRRFSRRARKADCGARYPSDMHPSSSSPALPGETDFLLQQKIRGGPGEYKPATVDDRAEGPAEAPAPHKLTSPHKKTRTSKGSGWPRHSPPMTRRDRTRSDQRPM